MQNIKIDVLHIKLTLLNSDLFIKHGVVKYKNRKTKNKDVFGKTYVLIEI